MIINNYVSTVRGPYQPGGESETSKNLGILIAATPVTTFPLMVGYGTGSGVAALCTFVGIAALMPLALTGIISLAFRTTRSTFMGIKCITYKIARHL